MKKEIFNKIKIPEEVEVSIDGNIVTVKGPEGSITKKFNVHKFVLKVESGEIIIGSKKATRSENKNIQTITAHIKNMVKGVQEKFEYELKIASSHFPMTVDIQGNKISIKNFLGEKIPREAKLPEGVEVEKDKDIIKVKSINKELAGQAAAIFERTTKVKNKDRRIFQDGIFIINKAGKEIA